MSCVRANEERMQYRQVGVAASNGSSCSSSSSLVSISLRDSLADETNNSNESTLKFMRPEKQKCSNFISNEKRKLKSENKKICSDF